MALCAAPGWVRCAAVTEGEMRRVLIAALLLVGCGGMAIQHAEDVASQQHNCPRDRVHFVRNGGDWMYWIDVCGEERLYDTRGGRYEDVTQSTR